jgi:hypothetical protein
MRIILDFNCIIALENGEESAGYLRKLISLHDQNEIDLCVPAISGVEKLPNGDYSKSLSDLQNRLKKLSRRPLEILDTMAYLGMWFLGHGIFGNDELIELDKEIHNILFPEIPCEWDEYLKLCEADPDYSLEKWKNVRCDVISMWCHIYHKTDIFISSDNNFSKSTKVQSLKKLGANKILKPKEAYEYIVKPSLESLL